MNINDIPFFKGVDTTLIEKTHIVSKKYHKNEIIYAQGTPCTSMDLVLSGRLVAYSLAQNGSENIMFEFEKDSIIGANLLFGNANHYPMNIYCTENCELLPIKKADIELLLSDHQFMMRFIRSISLNSQGMNKKIAMFTQKSLRENLMDYFSALSDEQASETLVLPISKKQLADHLGVQRPSLFRELKKMKNEGLIAINNKQIKLLNK